MSRKSLLCIGLSVVCFGVMGIGWSGTSDAKRKLTPRKGVAKSRLPGNTSTSTKKKVNKNKPCRYKGKTYKNGQKYVSQYACNTCTCYSGKMKCRKNSSGCAMEAKCKAVASAYRLAYVMARRAKGAILGYKRAAARAKSAIARYKAMKRVLSRTPKNHPKYKTLLVLYNKAKGTALAAARAANSYRQRARATLLRAKAAMFKYMKLARATRCRKCPPNRYCTSFYTTPLFKRNMFEIDMMVNQWGRNPRGFEIDM